MKSNEFFNILDDMDERLVSEIYEDVQRPQKLRAERSSRKIPFKPIIAAAAGFAAIVTASALLIPKGLTANSADNISSTDNVSDVNGIGSSNSAARSWFYDYHMTPYREPNESRPGGGMTTYLPDEGFIFQGCLNYYSSEYEIRAVDNGTVVFAGKISDEYGSGVIIDHYGKAYSSYGCLDPESVTVSEGDTVYIGDVFAKPYSGTCTYRNAVVEFEVSDKPMNENKFTESCKYYCNIVNYFKGWYNENYGAAKSDGRHIINTEAGSAVTALNDGEIIYTGIDNNGSGMLVTYYCGNVYTVYRGLDTSFPDFTANRTVKGTFKIDETIGYVGNSEAYWILLDPLEYKEFCEENGIDFSFDHVNKQQ